MKYLKIFTDFIEIAEPLSDEERGRLFMAMLAYARKLTEKPPLSADEAWALAIRAIRRYGTGQRNWTTGKLPHEMARDSLPAEVWRVMDLMGYRDMCMSSNMDVVRAQFIRAWERQEKLREERQSLLSFLPAGLKGPFLALTEGGGGNG